jgi:hypothetical protein
MGLNRVRPNGSRTATAAVIAERRRLVAAMRLRGADQRAIVGALAKGGHRNPETGKPWSLGTVNADCQALEAEWRAAALADTTEHQGRVWAELSEVKRAAWQEHDLQAVLRALKQECDLLGLNAPERVDLSLYVEQLAEQYGWDKARALAEADRILAGL